jgi:20S proteasome alpha/beta subunit
VTTIAYRDGVLAADTRGYAGDARPLGQKSKIERLEDGTLIGVSSSIPGGGETVRRWYADGRPNDIELPANFTMIAISREGDVFYAKDMPHLSGPLRAPYFAIGSGADFALGALEAGMSAKGSVLLACRLDVWSDEPVEILELEESA